MTEWRRHPRIKESLPVRWTTGFLGLHGRGIIRNISLSGILLEVDDHFKPSEDGLYRLDVTESQLATYVPSDVKFVWSSARKTDRLRKYCGMKFTNAQGLVLTRLAQHLQERQSSFSQAADLNIIQNYLSQSN